MKAIDEQKLEREIFFPVSLHPLYLKYSETMPNMWGEREYYEQIKRYFAVVDDVSKHVFSTVTDSYVLITNKEARDFAVSIAKDIFNTKDGIELACIDYHMTARRTECEMDLIRNMEISQPLINDGWIPFIRVSNSYNKSKMLCYTIGYINRKTNWEVLDPELSVSASEAHLYSKNGIFLNIHKRINKLFTEIGDINLKFILKVALLKHKNVAKEDMLPLICKYQKIEKANVKDNQRLYLHYKMILDFLNDHIESSVKEYGTTAYALLNVMAAFCTVFDKDPMFCYHRTKNQMAVGKWVDDFISATRQPDFSMYKYLGEDAYNTASWLRTL